MNNRHFYTSGLKFSCKRCSNCCRKESGFVYLSENDLSLLARDFKMGYTEFVETWCRWVPFAGGRERLSLREKPNFDCVFWDSKTEACSVYNARPLQCRTFPFWDYVLCSKEAWNNTGKDCPGIGNGEYYDMEKIDGLLRIQSDEPVIERDIPKKVISHRGLVI